MTLSSDAAAGSVPTRLERFDLVERLVHWTNAVLFLALIATGAALYGAPLTGWIGNRDVVKAVHIWVGLALPVPIVVGIALSRALRADLRRFSRWTRDDQRWWSRRLRAKVRVGKFNPGQKANAAFIGAAIVVLLMTGVLLRWPGPFSDDWRTGATFVHDSFALAVGIVIIGHIAFALRDPAALRSMWTGWIPTAWAERSAPRWLDESVPETPASTTTLGPR